MVIHACFLVVLIGMSVGGAGAEDRGPMVSSNHVLADVEQVCVVLAVDGAAPVEHLIDAGRLKNQVVTRLTEGGVGCVQRGTQIVPRLIAHVETVCVPETGKYVYRVQTSADRLVTVGRSDMQVRAQVWQSRPVMEVIAGLEMQEAVAGAVLAQAEVFVGACRTARLQDQTQTARQEGTPGPTPVGPQDLQQVAAHPFVASRNSPVFHRADCRWAQNISEGNRVGYETREQAVQAGKRPCKTCKP